MKKPDGPPIAYIGSMVYNKQQTLQNLATS
jgi:hypothetical protein